MGFYWLHWGSSAQLLHTHPWGLWVCHQSPTIFACIALSLPRPILTFFHIIHCLWVCYLLFLSFEALLSPFAFLKPIYLFHGLVIHYFCRLDLMVFVLYLLPTSFRSVLLGWASSLSFGFHKKDPQQKSYCWRRKWENFYDEIQFEINLEISMAVLKFENNCMRFKYKQNK